MPRLTNSSCERTGHYVPNEKTGQLVEGQEVGYFDMDTGNVCRYRSVPTLVKKYRVCTLRTSPSPTLDLHTNNQYLEGDGRFKEQYGKRLENYAV